MLTIDVGEAQESLVELLAAVERGEEIIITRHDRPIARLTAFKEAMTPFPDRSQLRSEIPAMRTPAAQSVREQRDEEPY